MGAGVTMSQRQCKNWQKKDDGQDKKINNQDKFSTMRINTVLFKKKFVLESAVFD